MKYNLVDFAVNKNHLIIFFVGVFVFAISCAGVFDPLSVEISKLLYNELGYTNKWSRTYGDPWFVKMNSNISAFGSKEVVSIFTIFFFTYLIKTRSKTKALNFLLTVVSGIILILFVKSLTSQDEYITIVSVLTENLSNFPSGHTFIATVLYLAAASALNSKIRRSGVNHYFFIAASIVIFLVGISRITGSGHTVTEVIAGWSLGISWYSLSEIVLKFYLPKKESKINT